MSLAEPPLLAALQDARVLLDRLPVDAIVLVDGGTDILMRGDEAGLGTPQEARPRIVNGQIAAATAGEVSMRIEESGTRSEPGFRGRSPIDEARPVVLWGERNRSRTSPGWVERSGRASGRLGPAGPSAGAAVSTHHPATTCA